MSLLTSGHRAVFLTTIGSLLIGFALTFAGIEFSWTSARILTPLIIGFYLAAVAVYFGGYTCCRALVGFALAMGYPIADQIHVDASLDVLKSNNRQRVIATLVELFLVYDDDM